MAIINTPGGGSSRNVRRPNLIPGVDPYLKDGTQWLNPAAFSIPAPGEFGNLQRGVLRGPSFKQVDMVAAKRSSRCRHVERRVPLGDLQPLQHQQLRAARGDAAERAG